MTETAHTPLPCPFCGGDKVLISQTLDQKAPNWFAACHRATCAFTGYSSTEAEALTAWNTRADSHHRLVKALEVMRGYGCPVCSGDCGSANPPVMSCPMLMIDAALKEAVRG